MSGLRSTRRRARIEACGRGRVPLRSTHASNHGPDSSIQSVVRPDGWSPNLSTATGPPESIDRVFVVVFEAAQAKRAAREWASLFPTRLQPARALLACDGLSGPFLSTTCIWTNPLDFPRQLIELQTGVRQTPAMAMANQRLSRLRDHLEGAGGGVGTQVRRVTMRLGLDSVRVGK